MQYQNYLIIIIRPAAIDDIVIILDYLTDDISVCPRLHFCKVLRMIGPGSAHQCGHIAHHQGSGFHQIAENAALRGVLTAGIQIGIHQTVVRIKGEDFEIHIVGIYNAVLTNILMDLAFRIIQVFFEIRQIIFLYAGCDRCVQLQVCIAGINGIRVPLFFLSCIFSRCIISIR